MLFPEKTVSGIGELLSALVEARREVKGPWYRGQWSDKWKLVPSIARPPYQVGLEIAYIKRFLQNAQPFVAHPLTDKWEQLFLMRHHGAPTRLLDWSENP